MRVKLISLALIAATRSLPLTGKKKTLLKRHCEATVFFQQLMADLQEKTASLSIWELGFEDLASTFLTSIEELSFDQTIVEPSMPQDGAAHDVLMNRMELASRKRRDRCDYVNLIINEARTRCVGTKNREPSIEEVGLALSVAQSTDRIHAAWDHYTFHDIKADVKGNLLVLGRLQRSEEERDAVHSRRVNFNDLEVHSSHNLGFSTLKQEFTEELQSVSITPLDTFLGSAQGISLFDSFTAGSEVFLETISAELHYLVDIEEMIPTPAGHFTYTQLARFWSFLYQMSFVVQVWSSATVRFNSQLQVGRVSVHAFENVAAKRLGEPIAQIKKYLKLFVSTKSRRVDLFYRPLLRVKEDALLIAPTFIQTSRFDRNLLRLLVAQEGQDVSVKGRRPLTRLEKQFRRAGFSYKRDVLVLKEELEVTDADVLAAKDDVLFIFQSKVLSVSDSAYEEWRNRQSLEFAAVQMNACFENLAMIFEQHGTSLGVNAKSGIAPYLLTNVWSFTGSVIGGYKVTDLSYLGNLLNGALVRVRRSGETTAMAALRLIAGSVPTAKELGRLLDDPAHAQYLGAEGIYRRHTFAFGDKAIRMTTRVLTYT